MKFTEVPYRYLKEFFLTATGMQYSDSTTYYNVISSVTSGSGSISPLGTYAYREYTSATYTFSPSAGYEISNVVVDGTSQGVISSYSFTNLSTNHTISVEFSEIVTPYNITSSVTSGSGNISPSGAVEVLPGEDQTFTMTASAGYEINDVFVNSISIGPTASYTFEDVDSDATIEVFFWEAT